MKGFLPQPDLHVDIELKKIGMTIPGLLQNLHTVSGKVRMTPQAIFLDSLQGMLDTGRFDLAGTIDLKQYQPSKVLLKLNADKLPLTIPNTLEARLNTKLNVQGTPEKYLISGNVQILEGLYYKDIQLNLMEDLVQKPRKKDLAPSNIQWPLLKNMALDITSRQRDPFIVDNNIALLTITPDIRIYGSLDQPLISGRAEVESGTVYFQKKEFKVKKGIFDFINPYKIEPTIDIQSEVNIRNWTLFLNFSGIPDNLRFNVTSDPPETYEDILSLLVTGKTTQELIQEEGGSSRSSAQLLANILATRLEEDVKDATGLDIVKLKYEAAKNGEESDEIKVLVGKELSRRVTVKYGLQTKNAKVVQQAIAEYKLLEKLLMNTFQDTEGQFGGGFQFRLEFR